MTTEEKNDQHFQSLAHPFVKNIYGSYKGRLRLALLRDDLFPAVDAGKTLLDVGAGLAQLSGELRLLGVDAYALDAAAEMREQAESFALDQSALPWQERYCVMPLQDYCLPSVHADGYDWVLCHAVLAWLRAPAQALLRLGKWVRPGGCLSILFYNRDSMALQQIFRGRYGYLEKMWARTTATGGQMSTDCSQPLGLSEPFYPGGLTPQTPLSLAWVTDQLTGMGFRIQLQRGVRCFADYMHAEVRARLTEEQLLSIERSYRAQMPFLAMARYIHVIAKKPTIAKKSIVE